MILSPAPRRSAGPAPVRPAGSVRRTSSIDVSWPEGRAGHARFVGRARDVATGLAGGPPRVLAEDSFEARLTSERMIVSIEADPPRPGLARLVGERGGGGLRKVLQVAVPEERRQAAPLYLILDDLAGASLVAAWAWSQWEPDWLNLRREGVTDARFEELFRSKVGICSGFAPGSAALDPKADRSHGAPAPELRNPDDPDGWHAFTVQDGAPGMRRARRIDVTLGESIVVDSAFQDSATTPAGGRQGVHEYTLTLTADPASLKVVSIEAQPRILPFPECPTAAANLSRLVGVPLPELRERVLTELKGVLGCTHLNDAVRALAEVPALASRLQPA